MSMQRLEHSYNHWKLFENAFIARLYHSNIFEHNKRNKRNKRPS